MSPEGGPLMATGDQGTDQYHLFALFGLAVTGILTGAVLVRVDPL